MLAAVCPVEVASVTVFPSSRYPDESYRVFEDGRILNFDGFLVPRSFAEFHQEFPLHVQHFVRRYMPHASLADREDRESELNLFLMDIPPGSKFRAPGTNGFPDGCRDRIQTFAPERAYGASKPRFLSFVNTMLTNYSITLGKRRHTNPILWQSNELYMPGRAAQPFGGNVSDEWVHLHQHQNLRADNWGRETSQLDDPVLIAEFLGYLVEHSPELEPLYHTLKRADSFLDAQIEMGMTEQLFTRARNRLQVLVECFHASRLRPPQQRKVYCPRKSQQPLPPVTEERIRLLAYALWQERGWHSDQDRNWLDAERELKGGFCAG